MLGLLNDEGKTLGESVMSIAKWAFKDDRQSVWDNLQVGLKNGLHAKLKEIQDNSITFADGRHMQIVFWETHDYKAWGDMMGGAVCALASHFDLFNEAISKADRGKYYLCTAQALVQFSHFAGLIAGNVYEDVLLPPQETYHDFLNRTCMPDWVLQVCTVPKLYVMYQTCDVPNMCKSSYRLCSRSSTKLAYLMQRSNA